MNYTAIIIGNVCTLFAMGANAVSSTRKTAKGMLGVQCISQLIYCLSAVVLRGYSAAVQNVVSIFRNVVAVRNIKSKTLTWLLVVAGVVLGVVFNNRGLMGLLPVAGNLQYTLAIFWLRDKEKLLKLSFLVSGISFLIYNVVIYNFVGIVADFVVAVTTAAALLKGMANKSGE